MAVADSSRPAFGQATAPALSITQTRAQTPAALNLTGQPGSAYGLEFSSNSVNWLPFSLETDTRGLFQTIDRHSPFSPVRFYRATSGDLAALPPGNSEAITTSLNDLAFFQGATGSLTAQLSVQPAQTVTVSITIAGSTNIAIASGASLSFTPANWNVPQTVTLSASPTTNSLNASATLTLSAPGVPSQSASVIAMFNGANEEFVGPFASWLNVKTGFGAKGDGVTDDTAAIQNALNAIRPYSKSGALYFPPGTYRITQTLNVLRTNDSDSKDILIIGADPSTTTIRWAGASSGIMIEYQAWYAKMSRLTLDGAGVAQTAIYHGSQFSTHNEFSDMVFTNMAFGIEAGTDDGEGNAETVVERCRFANCSSAAVSLENPNSLNWFVWGCEFDDCALGVSNLYGSGNYHVYNCLFQRSTQADVSFGNTGYFSIRNNLSISSAAFFMATAVDSCGLVTLQGNTVVKPAGTPVVDYDLGPVLLLDNLIQDFNGVSVNIEPSAGFVSVGNVYTVTNALQASPSGVTLDDVVSFEKIPVTFPRPPVALTNYNRPIIDVPASTNGIGIQAALNQAAAMNGQKPIVHMPAGTYLITNAITIPANSDVQLTGDGARTQLRWAGTTTGPMLHLPGPVRATLRDFTLFAVNGNILADGILADNTDQVGGRVYLEQVDVDQATNTGFFCDSLHNVSVDLEALYHSANNVSVAVHGNGELPEGTNLAGRVGIFGGAGSGNVLSFDVQSNASLLVWDMWYESKTPNQPVYMALTNSGFFTLHGANIAPNSASLAVPTVSVSNFKGMASFLTTMFSVSNNNVSVTGNADVMLMATLNANQPNYALNATNASLIQSYQNDPTIGDNLLFDEGPNDPGYLRTMLQQTRTETPLGVTALPAGVTDFRMYRVFVQGSLTGIHLKP